MPGSQPVNLKSFSTAFADEVSRQILLVADLHSAPSTPLVVSSPRASK